MPSDHSSFPVALRQFTLHVSTLINGLIYTKDHIRYMARYQSKYCAYSWIFSSCVATFKTQLHLCNGVHEQQCPDNGEHIENMS